MSRYQLRYSNSADEAPSYGYLLGDVSIPNYEYYNAELVEEINTAGTLTFTLLSTNPALPNLALRKSTIMLFREDKEIWRGRIIRIETDMYNRKTVTCEGVLAWLYDVVQKYYVSDGVYPNQAIMVLLISYIASCSQNRRIYRGIVEPDQLWYRTDTEYSTTFDILADLLANSGGYFRARCSSYTSAVYLDYLNFPTEPSGQPIIFGQNLFDIASTIDVSNVITRVRAEDTAGHSVTINDSTLEDAFGVSETYCKFDIEFASNVSLGVYAKIWLLQNSFAESTINVSALDLNLTDEAYEAFAIGQAKRVISPPHGIDTTMILTGLRTNISNPEASQITLGTVSKGLTNYVAQGGNGVVSVSAGSGWTIDKISPTFTQTAGNSTLSVTDARKYGKVVEIGFHITVTDSIAEGENIWVGTLSNYRPVTYMSTASYYGVATPSAGVFRITGAGEVNFRLVKGALSSGASMYCGLTYITEE